MKELQCIYDSRKSFYGKAKIETITNKNVYDVKLYSYGTLVARYTKVGNKAIYNYFGLYSQTTTRHQKEFFKQYSLNDEQINKLFKCGILELSI